MRAPSIRIPTLGRLLAGGKHVTGVEAVDAAHDGDQVAAEAVELWGERLGIGIANAINTFDPEEVVIGGGAARAGELLLEPARRVAAGYVVPGLGSADDDPSRAPRRARRASSGAALLAVHELAEGPARSPTEAIDGDPSHGARADVFDSGQRASPTTEVAA